MAWFSGARTCAANQFRSDFGDLGLDMGRLASPILVFADYNSGMPLCVHCDGACEPAHHPLNVTDHLTADWTPQQFREALPSNHEYLFLIHDRNSIYSVEFDEQIRSMGLAAVKIPARAPKANALCERLIGTIRRECLDFSDSLGRIARSPHMARLRSPLQRRPSTFQLGTLHS